MDRRRFLGVSAGAVSAACLGTTAAAGQDGRRESTSLTSPVSVIGSDRATIEEAPRRTRVAAEVDVLVVGGGPTGVGAALAAAGEGAKTLVLERHGMLGGMWTAGLLNPLFESRKGWLVEQLVDRLRQAKAWQDHAKFPVFDVEMMKYTLEQMLAEVNVDFWYHVQATDPVVVGDCVRGVIVEGKSGREAVLARTIVDCTGDGDIAARAGVPFRFGREFDGLAQPMTLMFEVTGAETIATGTQNILKLLKTAIAEHNLPIELPYGPNPHGTPYSIPVPEHGAAAIQATHVYRYNATDTRDVTHATVEARQQVHEIFLPAMRKVPGLEKLRLSQTAPSIGIRESRHFEGRYTLDADDVIGARRFDDAVTSCAFGCDIHEIYPGDTHARRIRAKPFEIPYRCLLPKSLKGLLFAGRCISGTHEAHASYRVTGTCMAMGQAAGLAAATAADRGVAPDEIDGCELRATLEDRGVQFL
jgi:hypothetical protein